MGFNDPFFSFERSDGLDLLPLSARRALDRAGVKLSLDGWRSLPLLDRQALAEAGLEAEVPVDRVRSLCAAVGPAARPIEPIPEPDLPAPPADLQQSLGPDHPLDEPAWARLHPLEQHALLHLSRSGQKGRLRALRAELLGTTGAPARATTEAPRLSHLDERGDARMVDVGPKPPTHRRALASARVQIRPDVLSLLGEGGLPKGDAFGVARVAGIQAAKRTPELIPLCHGVALTRVDVRFVLDREGGEVRVEAEAEAIDRTGVEMEAMVAASVASLALYDMVKGLDRSARVTAVQLEQKSGGKTGSWVRP
jgi:cyclic pyranopterin phosphate synthase